MSVQANDSVVLDFFIDVLRSNPVVLTEIKSSSGGLKFNNGRLTFSIVELYEFLDRQQLLSLSEFKKKLYHSNINQQLAVFGGELVVQHSLGKVDKNRYCLRSFDSI